MPLSARVRSLLAVSMLCLCSSCFTLGLWGIYPDDEDDPTGDDGGFAYDSETRWTWELVGMRLLLTPFALGLDVLTCPVQCAIFCCDSDCKKTCR